MAYITPFIIVKNLFSNFTNQKKNVIGTEWTKPIQRWR